MGDCDGANIVSLGSSVSSTQPFLTYLSFRGYRYYVLLPPPLVREREVAVVKEVAPDMPCCLLSEDNLPGIEHEQTSHAMVSSPFNDFADDGLAQVGAECGFLQIPAVDIRPNSAPAVIPKVPLKCHAPGIFPDAHNRSGTDLCNDLLTALAHNGEKVGSALLATPIQGSLDFNFPVGDTTQQDSIVSMGLELELKRDAEVRGRSLSPKRSQPFDTTCHVPVAAARIQQTQPQPAHDANIIVSSTKSEDLAKLRVQQQQLANQLRSLQEQEWAILERRNSESSLNGTSPGHTQSNAMYTDQTEVSSRIPHVPTSHSSSVGGRPSSEGETTLYDSFETNKTSLKQRGTGSEAHSTPPSSNTPLTPPTATPAAAKPLSPGASLLNPNMLDLKSAPPGHRLDPFLGQIGMVAKDQHGCRFLQRLCEEGNTREITIIFEEVVNLTGELMVDPFGNYLMQKLCEQCSETQRTVLIGRVAAEIPRVSCEMHGTRAVQKVVEQLRTPEQIRIMRTALSQHTVPMVKDLNANHVIQKCLQKFDTESKQFIYDAVTSQLHDVAMHRHGCCVLQRCIDFGSPEQKMQLVEEVLRCTPHLLQDPFGNYVVQYILDMDNEYIIASVTRSFCGNLLELAMNKFSSNVLEKCLKKGQPESRLPVLRELCDPRIMPQLLQDQFANYVVQTSLTICTIDEFNMIAAAIRPFLHTVKNTPHGKKIEMRLNKRAGEPTSPQATGYTSREGKGALSASNLSSSGSSHGSNGRGRARQNSGSDLRAQKGGSSGQQWGGWQGGQGPPPSVQTSGQWGGTQTGSGGTGMQPQYPNNSRGGRHPQRNASALRADAPSYNPGKKVEVHTGVPPTAHW